MSLTIPTNLSKTILKPLNPKSSSPSRPLLIQCSASQSSTNDSPLKAFSAALALSSILLSAPLPAVADISGLTPCKESKQFAKREKQSLKKLESSLKLYAPDSAPALAIKATMEKTKRRFDNYGKQGLLCGADGLPHLIVSGDQRHWVWSSEVSAGLLLLTESSSMVILLSRTSNSSADQTMRGRQRKKSKCGGNDIECLNWEFTLLTLSQSSTNQPPAVAPSPSSSQSNKQKH
ncbi:hypothetical protein LWI29_023207 [Acer saccharum]|uniref:Photosystem I reaction center subunit III n=1 Tax=Acer saccharum TaxID=4024 RepID=A0AA39RR87_ACESA|nr:hypothetical protein LWI29_023207 [Acer saccharum]